MHLEQGWGAFRTGDYQRACSQFSLADGYSSISPAEQAEARVALLYARVALEQFTEAVGTLRWLLEKHLQGSLKADPSFASLVPDLPSRYGRRDDLDGQKGHLDRLREYVTHCEMALQGAGGDPVLRNDIPRLRKNAWEAKALQLVVEYAIPETRSRALFDLDAFASAPEPWNGVSKLVRGTGSESGDASSGVVAPARPAVEFPFNLFQEAPPPALVAPPSTP